MVEREGIQGLGLAKLPLLMLDLDGVVVHEAIGSASRELIILHRDLGERLLEAGQETVIVTHRSRREAIQILRAARILEKHILKLLAAEDVLRGAVRQRAYLEVLQRGLSKDFVLPIVERISRRPREDIVLLDDRQYNLQAVSDAGVGLTIKAPFDISEDRKSIETFDFSYLLENLNQWHRDRKQSRQIDLPRISMNIMNWQRSGLSTEKLEGHIFNRARRLAYSVRTSVANKS